jgi:hypothetical protein
MQLSRQSTHTSSSTNSIVTIDDFAIGFQFYLRHNLKASYIVFYIVDCTHFFAASRITRA